MRSPDISDKGAVGADSIVPQRVTLPPLPAIVRGSVHHVRHRPLRHAFTHRHDQWLVDLDHGTRLPPGLNRLCRVRPVDHLLGGATFTDLKVQVIDVVAREVSAGIEGAEGINVEAIEQVVLLAQARVLGHVFDPLSTYWCLTGDGAVVAVVLEVRNTYGGRRSYVVVPDRSGRADVEKDFVVSPFNDGTGHYAVRLQLSPERVATSIALSADGIPLLTAATWGVPHQLTTREAVRYLLTAPLMPQRVSWLIRWHGLRLWLRRLPIRTPKELRT